MAISYNFDNLKFRRLTLEGGRTTRQFNTYNPITPTLNTLYSLWDKKNYIQLYEKDYAQINYRQELFNGVYFNGTLEYAERRPLMNNTNYSFREKDEVYAPNTPQFIDAPDQVFESHQALLFRAVLRLRIQQKYISYPGRKFIMGSKYPDILIRYAKGFKMAGSDVDFDLVRIAIRDDWQIGLFGRTEFTLEGGRFVNKNRAEFPDFKHFRGNQTFIGKPDNYLSTFHLLPYYEFSTTNDFVEAHFQHHFDGFLLDKIPFIRKLHLKTVLGASWLYVDGRDHYNEVSFGIDNLGFGVLRIFRIDAVASFRDGKYDNFGLMLGINL